MTRKVGRSVARQRSSELMRLVVAAWPATIDAFVEYAREKKGTA